ncbi:MAG: hypothetical protein JXX14_17405 [Deltaproteobacteria bacterium]|nr:hypothetical protein [Deltaproteobacteria bacterium]
MMKPLLPFPASLFLLMLLFSGCGGDNGSAPKEKPRKHNVTEKVNLDIHIMSKCTWSAKVLTTLFPLVEKMDGSLNLNLHYIAREEKGEWKSIHGESEILGNTIQLCARKHAQSDSAWISFLKCQVKDWSRIPSGWEKCASQAKLDVDTVQKCVAGDEGKKLVVASFKYSQEKGAKGSPTIYLAGAPYSGGRTEASFRRAICEKFSTTKPEYCQNIPRPTKVPVTVVTDKRCEGRLCNPRRFLAFVRSTFEGAEIRTLDYSEEEGKRIYLKSSQPYLPVAIFGPTVEKVETGFNRLRRHLTKLENTGEYVYPLGQVGTPQWDPRAEICNDGIDNTGNGKVDCDDDSCFGKKVCRDEIAGRVDLFVMSHCHYGMRTINAMAPVLTHFKNDRDRIDFHLQYIGQIEDEQLTALHGPSEVAENKRQICAQKYYARNYRFMEYVLCRNEYLQKNNLREDEYTWEECALNGISAAVLRRCSESDEGTQLLADSYRLAESLGITGSPGWLLNNRFEMRARSPMQIRDAFCTRNNEVDGCETPIERNEFAAGSPVPDNSCDGNPPPILRKFSADTDTTPDPVVDSQSN